MVMGIVNVTPDSFSDGGQFSAHDQAITHGQMLLREGADLLDIGGESTRPGATEVSAEDEISRILPVISGLALAQPGCVLSVDTYKASTAEGALKAGARIVNDVWGLQRDGEMAHVVAAHDAGLVIMHNRTTKVPDLDIITDMEHFFGQSLEIAAKAGIPLARIALDPGIGFGKTFEQNLTAIRAISRLKAFGCAVLLGTSRKGFLGLITGRPVNERVIATVATSVIGMLDGADIVRVHDVGAHRDALRVTAALAAAQL